MSIVVDLGCFSHEGEQDASLDKLRARFEPDVLYGFDPWLKKSSSSLAGKTQVVLSKLAVWTHDGRVRLSRGARGYDSTVMATNEKWRATTTGMVRCIDFSRWLARFDTGGIVLKADIEGAEVPVLEKMIFDGTDRLVKLLLVEWHDRLFDDEYAARRERIERGLRCRVELWD